MVTIKTQITSCKQCPFWKEGPTESIDGFDMGNDWICKHPSTNGKIISGFVEWHEVSKITIPKWCPIKVI